jgi:hypothetical protein
MSSRSRSAWALTGIAVAIPLSGAGLVVAATSTYDYWLAPQPWIGWGLSLVCAGVVLTTCFGAILVTVGRRAA